MTITTRSIRAERDAYAAAHPEHPRPSRFSNGGADYAAWAARADAWADDQAEQAERTATPWERYHEHSAAHMKGRRETAHMTPQRFERMVREWGGMVTEPHHTNQMQSAPYVLFGRYELEPTAEHPHGHVVATYCEGDVTVERYATRERARRAVWLLERAL